LESSQVDWLGLLLQYSLYSIGQKQGGLFITFPHFPLGKYFSSPKKTRPKPESKPFLTKNTNSKNNTSKLQKQHFKLQKQQLKQLRSTRYNRKPKSFPNLYLPTTVSKLP